jgi:ribosomal protein S27AE
VLGVNTAHFTGMRWNIGIAHYHTKMRPAFENLLIDGSNAQSYKLKKRLYEVGLESPKCEMCGWATMAEDGRIPVELDHINGRHDDNRLVNLRVLCPNCHSLQATHRGKNKGVRYARVV